MSRKLKNEENDKPTVSNQGIWQKKKNWKRWKRQMHTIRPEIWQETLKKIIMHTLGPVICRGNWKKKRGKCEIHTLRPGIWQENLKN